MFSYDYTIFISCFYCHGIGCTCRVQAVRFQELTKLATHVLHKEARLETDAARDKTHPHGSKASHASACYDTIWTCHFFFSNLMHFILQFLCCCLLKIVHAFVVHLVLLASRHSPLISREKYLRVPSLGVAPSECHLVVWHVKLFVDSWLPNKTHAKGSPKQATPTKRAQVLIAWDPDIPHRLIPHLIP